MRVLVVQEAHCCGRALQASLFTDDRVMVSSLLEMVLTAQLAHQVVIVESRAETAWNALGCRCWTTGIAPGAPSQSWMFELGFNLFGLMMIRKSHSPGRGRYRHAVAVAGGFDGFCRSCAGFLA